MNVMLRVILFNIPTLACTTGISMSISKKVKNFGMKAFLILLTAVTFLSSVGDGALAELLYGNERGFYYYVFLALIGIRPALTATVWFALKNSMKEQYFSWVICIFFWFGALSLGILNDQTSLMNLSRAEFAMLMYELAIILAGFIGLSCWFWAFLRRKMIGLRTDLLIYAILMMLPALLLDFFFVEMPNFCQFLSIATVMYSTNRMIRQLEKQMENAQRSQHAELMASQIQPHFLFNALNAIYELCGKDPKEAQSTIDDFATFLRMNLRRLGNYMVPFTDEMMHVDAYLHIEQIRFGSRLNVVRNIQEENFMLPPLTLQPLVENAVRHGVCKKEEGGTVYIYSRRIPEGVEIVVEDNGVGFDTSKPIDEREHVGMANVRQRLQVMAKGDLQITSEIGKGTKAVIRLLV